jgi:hypothetical protein
MEARGHNPENLDLNFTAVTTSNLASITMFTKANHYVLF